MDVMILLLFVGIALALLAVAFFAWNVRSGALQHADRLALLPLADDAPARDLGTTREEGTSVGLRVVARSQHQEGRR